MIIDVPAHGKETNDIIFIFIYKNQFVFLFNTFVLSGTNTKYVLSTHLFMNIRIFIVI